MLENDKYLWPISQRSAIPKFRTATGSLVKLLQFGTEETHRTETPLTPRANPVSPFSSANFCGRESASLYLAHVFALPAIIADRWSCPLTISRGRVLSNVDVIISMRRPSCETPRFDSKSRTITLYARQLHAGYTNTPRINCPVGPEGSWRSRTRGWLRARNRRRIGALSSESHYCFTKWAVGLGRWL